MKRKFVMGMAAVAAVTCFSSAQAQDTFFVGARATGMAGANVAAVDDNSAQYYNPAAFGFFGRTDADGKRSASDRNNLGRKDFGFDVYAGAGQVLANDFGNYLDELANIDIDSLSDGIQGESDVVNLVKLVNNLNGLDQPGNAMIVNLNGGSSLRVKHFAVGLRVYSEIFARATNVDITNLGADVDVATINTQIQSTSPAGNDGQVEFFTDAEQQALITAGLAADSIQILDYTIRSEGLADALTDDQRSDLVEGLSAYSSGGGSLDSNDSRVLLSGYAVAEVPVSYGYALNDRWSIGANLKLLRGRVYGTEVLVFDDAISDAFDTASEKYKETTTFAVDLGVMARYGLFNFGLVGRNLNTPKLDGLSYNYTPMLPSGVPGTTRPVNVPDVELKPQLTAGVAFLPFDTVTIELDYDLTKNETVAKNYDSQNLSFGAEWTPFHVLALRAGALKNLAESDLGLIYTGGIGVNFWLIRLDISAASSLGDKVVFEGDEYPKYNKVAAQVSVDF